LNSADGEKTIVSSHSRILRKKLGIVEAWEWGEKQPVKSASTSSIPARHGNESARNNFMRVAA
jgi:hypothetical protein